MPAESETNPKSRIGRAPYSKLAWRSAILTGMIVGLLSTVMSLSPTGRWIERTITYDWMFAARGIRPTPENVVVVSMDERKADLPTVTRDDRRWSRHVFAKLIEQLTAADAHAIVLDVALEDATDTKADEALERALLKSDRVVLFQRMTRLEIGDVPLLPLPRFASRARALAVFALPKRAGRVDGYWPFFRALEPFAQSDERTGSYEDESEDAYTLVELPSLPVSALTIEVLQILGAERFDQLLRELGHTSRQGQAALFATDDGVMQAMIDLRRTAMGGLLSGDEARRIVHRHSGDDAVASIIHSLFTAFAEPGALQLNFYGPARSIKTIEHGNVLDAGQVGSDALTDAVAGNVVFIGYSDRSAVDQKDGFRTVYTSDDGVDLSGVEIAATAYANLTDDSVLRPASAVATLLIHIVLGVLVLLIALNTSIIRAIAFTCALALAYFMLSAKVFEFSYYLLPLGVPVLLMLPITLFCALSYRHLGTLLQLDRYLHGMRLMMPWRAMRDIQANQVESAAPERLSGACMITDVADYAHLSEVLSNASLASMSREYFALLSEQVEKAGGELIDFEGDSMTAVWTRATLDTGNGRSATFAAIEIMRVVEGFNEKYSQTPFKTRIGIHAGELTVGNIGGGKNFRHRVVGDIVNTSSRLEGLNKRLGTSVLATLAVIADAEDVLVRPVGTFMLKGKEEVLEVVEVMGHRTKAKFDQFELIERYADALAAIDDGDYESAERRLAAILSNNRNDGPARFYAQLLKGVDDPDVRLDQRGIVRVKSK